MLIVELPRKVKRIGTLHQIPKNNLTDNYFQTHFVNNTRGLRVCLWEQLKVYTQNFLKITEFYQSTN